MHRAVTFSLGFSSHDDSSPLAQGIASKELLRTHTAKDLSLCCASPDHPTHPSSFITMPPRYVHMYVYIYMFTYISMSMYMNIYIRLFYASPDHPTYPSLPPVSLDMASGRFCCSTIFFMLLFLL
jgi:hypothetical protein